MIFNSYKHCNHRVKAGHLEDQQSVLVLVLVTPGVRHHAHVVRGAVHHHVHHVDREDIWKGCHLGTMLDIRVSGDLHSNI